MGACHGSPVLLLVGLILGLLAPLGGTQGADADGANPRDCARSDGTSHPDAHGSNEELYRIIDAQRTILETCNRTCEQRNEELRRIIDAQQALIASYNNVDGTRKDGITPNASPHSETEPISNIAQTFTNLFLVAIVVLATWLGRWLYKECSLFRATVLAHPNDPLRFFQFASFRMDVWIAQTPRWRESVLGFFTLTLVVVGGLGMWVATGSSLGQSMWDAWVFVVDTGAHGEQDGVHVRAVALLITVGGMIGFAMMVSALTDGLQAYMEAIRSGRSSIVCHDHSLILGWSDKTIPLIEELVEANRSEGGGIIVVLTEGSRADAEEQIEARICRHSRMGSTIVIRSGSAMLVSDLTMVSCRTARSISVLADNTLPPIQRDEKTIRVMLCLRSALWQQRLGDGKSDISLDEALAPLPMSPKRELWSPGVLGLQGMNYYSLSLKQKMPFPPAVPPQGMLGPMSPRGLQASAGAQQNGLSNESHQLSIVIELSDIDNVPLVNLLGGTCVETLVTHDFTGRMLLQASRQKGMARVMDHLIGFEGHEFYIAEWSQLCGHSFASVAYSFADAVPVGVYHPDGRHTLNPPDDYIMQLKDRVIVLAEDNDTYHPEAEPLFSYKAGDFGAIPLEPRMPLNILICGWRRDFGDLLEELDLMSATGTNVTLMSIVPEEDRDKRLGENNRCHHRNLKHISLRHHVGDHTNRKSLEALLEEDFDEILIVADEDCEANAIQSDGRTCAAMLQVMDIQRFKTTSTITVEVLDPRTRHLIENTKLSECVMSNELIASAIAMVSETREVASIVREILTSDGNEIYLHPANRYTLHGESVSFWEMSARCRDSKGLLIGYCRGEDVFINPSNKGHPITWEGEDKLIVVAED